MADWNRPMRCARTINAFASSAQRSQPRSRHAMHDKITRPIVQLDRRLQKQRGTSSIAGHNIGLRRRRKNWGACSWESAKAPGFLLQGVKAMAVQQLFFSTETRKHVSKRDERSFAACTVCSASCSAGISIACIWTRFTWKTKWWTKDEQCSPPKTNNNRRKRTRICKLLDIGG